MLLFSLPIEELVLRLEKHGESRRSQDFHPWRAFRRPRVRDLLPLLSVALGDLQLKLSVQVEEGGRHSRCNAV
jgi:hypothetical protein